MWCPCKDILLSNIEFPEEDLKLLEPDNSQENITHSGKPYSASSEFKNYLSIFATNYFEDLPQNTVNSFPHLLKELNSLITKDHVEEEIVFTLTKIIDSHTPSNELEQLSLARDIYALSLLSWEDNPNKEIINSNITSINNILSNILKRKIPLAKELQRPQRSILAKNRSILERLVDHIYKVEDVIPTETKQKTYHLLKQLYKIECLGDLPNYRLLSSTKIGTSGTWSHLLKEVFASADSMNTIRVRFEALTRKLQENTSYPHFVVDQIFLAKDLHAMEYALTAPIDQVNLVYHGTEDKRKGAISKITRQANSITSTKTYIEIFGKTLSRYSTLLDISPFLEGPNSLFSRVVTAIEKNRQVEDSRMNLFSKAFKSLDGEIRLFAVDATEELIINRHVT